MSEKTDSKKQLSYEELMAADTDKLSMDELQRRISLTTLKKAEREVELVEEQNEHFRENKIEKQRIAASKTTIIKENEDRITLEQNTCKHKTGGKGLAGFYNGDGKQGYSIATQELPTGEIYHLCFRCQKEWHLPKKRDVLSSKMTLAQYRQQEHEFFEVLAWEKPLFSTDSGAIPGSVKYRIPKLEAQRALDDAEFEEYLNRQRVTA